MLTLFKHDFMWYGAKITLCNKRVFSEVLAVYSVDSQYEDGLLISFLQAEWNWCTHSAFNVMCMYKLSYCLRYYTELQLMADYYR